MTFDEASTTEDQSSVSSTGVMVAGVHKHRVAKHDGEDLELSEIDSSHNSEHSSYSHDSSDSFSERSMQNDFGEEEKKDETGDNFMKAKRAQSIEEFTETTANLTRTSSHGSNDGTECYDENNEGTLRGLIREMSLSSVVNTPLQKQFLKVHEEVVEESSTHETIKDENHQSHEGGEVAASSSALKVDKDVENLLAKSSAHSKGEAQAVESIAASSTHSAVKAAASSTHSAVEAEGKEPTFASTHVEENGGTEVAIHISSAHNSNTRENDYDDAAPPLSPKAQDTSQLSKMVRSPGVLSRSSCEESMMLVDDNDDDDENSCAQLNETETDADVNISDTQRDNSTTDEEAFMVFNDRQTANEEMIGNGKLLEMEHSLNLPDKKAIPKVSKKLIDELKRRFDAANLPESPKKEATDRRHMPRNRETRDSFVQRIVKNVEEHGSPTPSVRRIVVSVPNINIQDGIVKAVAKEMERLGLGSDNKEMRSSRIVVTVEEGIVKHVVEDVEKRSTPSMTNAVSFDDSTHNSRRINMSKESFDKLAIPQLKSSFSRELAETSEHMDGKTPKTSNAASSSSQELQQDESNAEQVNRDAVRRGIERGQNEDTEIDKPDATHDVSKENNGNLSKAHEDQGEKSVGHDTGNLQSGNKLQTKLEVVQEVPKDHSQQAIAAPNKHDESVEMQSPGSELRDGKMTNGTSTTDNALQSKEIEEKNEIAAQSASHSLEDGSEVSAYHLYQKHQIEKYKEFKSMGTPTHTPVNPKEMITRESSMSTPPPPPYQSIPQFQNTPLSVSKSVSFDGSRSDIFSTVSNLSYPTNSGNSFVHQSPRVSFLNVAGGSVSTPRSTGSKVRKRISEMIRRDLWDRDETVVEASLLELAEKAALASQYRNAIARTGGILAIVRAMEMHMDHAGVQIAGCQALEKLALETENELAIGEVGGVDAVLTAMMGHVGNPVVQEAAWSALWNLTCGNACDEMTTDTEGGMHAIVACMKQHADHPAVQRNACGALTNLCLQNEERLRSLADADGFVAIAAALQNHWDDEDVKKEASHALTSLLSSPSSETIEEEYESDSSE